MRVLLLFLDGVGLGPDNPDTNPLAVAKMPHLERLLGGRRLLADETPIESQRASLFALDTCLGIKGLPQSATGQAALLTGQNVPAAIGCHYGPKPNPQIASILRNGTIFGELRKLGLKVSFLNAYPPRYFEAIESGKRLFSAIPLAVTSAGLPLATLEDLNNGSALSADFTGQGWHEHLGIRSAPLLAPFQAGQKLAQLGMAHDFSFFEYWLSDYAGHRQRMDDALALLETLDAVLGGLLETWNDQNGLILFTSDHGNLEDISTRRHTTNPVPALLIGSPALRSRLGPLKQLTDIAPTVFRFLHSP